MASPRVVIIGAGAAGVFTAYRLRQRHGDDFEVVLLERTGRVGGNAQSITVSFGGTEYSIDCGAQFFSRNPQPSYVSLLEDLGLFNDPAQIDARATGITLWDRQAGQRLLWLPSHLSGFLRYQPQDWNRLIGFATLLVYAFLLDRRSPANWSLSVDEWVDGLTLLDTQFKNQILRRFLYQFLTLPADRIGDASALYAITYFVRNVFGETGVDEPSPDVPAPPDGPTFEVYQSRIGLDGVLTRALDAAQIVPRLSEPVMAVSRNGTGGLDVTTSLGTIVADHVVFATDPNVAAAILSAGAFPSPGLIAALAACEYSDLSISLQSGGSCWMPDDQSYWEAVNTVADGDDLQFSVWFGALRDTFGGDTRIPVFKSWATGNLDPGSCPHTFFSHAHRILMPTTTFMTNRQTVQARQGENGVWFAGGWTTWFDSQEAALDSATAVVDALGGQSRVAAAGPTRSPNADRDRISRWLSAVAAWAPVERRRMLKNLLADVEAHG